MAEEEKFYVHKSGGHYYTENRIPISGKVLFEGTEKECYEFVKKEMEKKEIKEQLKSYEENINNIPLVIDPCKMCKVYKKHNGWFMGEFKNGEWEEGACKECCWFYDSKFEVGK